MRILISNDDGVYAPGIQVLHHHLKAIADCEVMAPDRNQSAMSSALTLNRPLMVQTLDNGFHSTDGTPTDCVHLALTGFFKKPFDMVISGINEGANLGDDTLYSGTVAAAMEGRYLGYPALAVSLVGRSFEYYQTAAIIIKKLVSNIALSRLPSQTILNINIPNIALSEIKGIDITRLGMRHKAEAMIEAKNPRGKTIYWIGPPGSEDDAGPGTDFYAVSQNKVSITPIHLDMTNYKLFEHLSIWTQAIDLQS